MLRNSVADLRLIICLVFTNSSKLVTPKNILKVVSQSGIGWVILTSTSNGFFWYSVSFWLHLNSKPFWFFAFFSFVFSVFLLFPAPNWHCSSHRLIQTQHVQHDDFLLLVSAQYLIAHPIYPFLDFFLKQIHCCLVDYQYHLLHCSQLDLINACISSLSVSLSIFAVRCFSTPSFLLNSFSGYYYELKVCEFEFSLLLNQQYYLVNKTLYNYYCYFYS